MATIVLANVLTDYRVVARTQARWKLQMHCRIINFIYFNWYNLLKLFYATLYLHSLCWLVSESFNKILYVGYFFLLVFVGAELLLVAFDTQYFTL